MNDLISVLRTFLEDHVADSLRRDINAHLRVILAGPPQEALVSLFKLLTNDGARDWRVMAGRAQVDVAVLLVRGLPSVGSAVSALNPPSHVSCECYWDHVINIRNAKTHLVMLVELPALSNIPDSLVNTTETLNFTKVTGQGQSFRDPLWRSIIQQISSIIRASESDIRFALKEVVKQSRDLEPATTNRVPWEIADNLLASTSLGLSPVDTVAFATGFPSLGTTGLSLKESAKALQRLKTLLDEEGLVDGIDKLKSTSTAIAETLQGMLDDLSDHVKRKAETSAIFALAPAWFYSPGRSLPGWWQTLNADVMNQMFDEIENTRRPQKLDLRCENALNSPTLLRGEPWFVRDEVRLRASVPAGVFLPSHVFKRKYGSAAVTLPPETGDDTACVDATIPAHQKPLRYLVEALPLVASAIDVVSLKSFECRGQLSKLAWRIMTEGIEE